MRKISYLVTTNLGKRKERHNVNLYIIFVCFQIVPEKTKESSGGPWEFVGVLPLFDPPRHDSAETIRRALDLGVNVKMITGLHTSSLFVPIAICKNTEFNLRYFFHR